MIPFLFPCSCSEFDIKNTFHLSGTPIIFRSGLKFVQGCPEKNHEKSCQDLQIKYILTNGAGPCGFRHGIGACSDGVCRQQSLQDCLRPGRENLPQTEVPSNAHISTPFFKKTGIFKIFGGISKFGINVIMKSSLQF
jgi:hypothetical protein